MSEAEAAEAETAKTEAKTKAAKTGAAKTGAAKTGAAKTEAARTEAAKTKAANTQRLAEALRANLRRRKAAVQELPTARNAADAGGDDAAVETTAPPSGHQPRG